MDDVLLVSGLVLIVVGLFQYAVGPLGLLAVGVAFIFIGLLTRSEETQ